MKHVLALLLIAMVSSRALAEDRPIGHLLLPDAKEIVLEREGTPRVFISGGQGEIVYDRQKSRKVVTKFSVRTEPRPDSEEVVDIDISGAMFELRTVTSPGTYEFQGSDDFRAHKDGEKRVLVYEKRDDWVRVKFRDQLPWNGRYGWVRMGENTGGFIAIGD